MLKIELEFLSELEVELDVTVTGFEIPEIDLLLIGDEIPEEVDDVSSVDPEAAAETRMGDF